MKLRLLTKVKELVASSPLTPAELADMAGTSVQWVHLLKSGRIKSPGVDTVERLYIGLTGSPLIGDDQHG